MVSTLSGVVVLLNSLSMSLLLKAMAVLKCSPNSMLMRDCDFEMYDETRLADMLQESCSWKKAEILKLSHKSL